MNSCWMMILVFAMFDAQPLTFTGNGQDQTAEFQSWLEQVTRGRKYGEIYGDVRVNQRLTLGGQRWSIHWRQGKLIVDHEQTVLNIADATRFELANWIIAPKKRAELGIAITSTDHRQRGYSRINGIEIHNCNLAMQIQGDSLEQSTISHMTTIGCPQALRINSPSLDLLTISNFSFRRSKTIESDQPIVDIVRSGSLRFNNGHVSHIKTTASCIKLHGGTHVLRDIWIENPGTLALDVRQARGRNDTIIDGLVCSPATRTTGRVTVLLKRKVNLQNCSFYGDVVYDSEKRHPNVLHCRLNDGATVRPRQPQP